MADELNYGIYEIFEIVIIILSVLIVFASLFYTKNDDVKEDYLLGKEIAYISSNINSKMEVEIKPINKYFEKFDPKSNGIFNIGDLEFNSIYKRVEFEKNKKDNSIIIKEI